MVFSALGIAKDELLLVAAVSVSLGTFGYMAVPWNAMLHGPGEKALALYQDIEKANEDYYETYRMWPHEVTTNDSFDNVTVLMSRRVLIRPYQGDASYQPVITEGLVESRAEGLRARHTYGADGGSISQVALNGGAYRYVIEFDNLTLDEAKDLDQAIDGEFDPGKGRLRVVEDGDAMVAKYLANPRNKSIAQR